MKADFARRKALLADQSQKKTILGTGSIWLRYFLEPWVLLGRIRISGSLVGQVLCHIRLLPWPSVSVYQAVGRISFCISEKYPVPTMIVLPTMWPWAVSYPSTI